MKRCSIKPPGALACAAWPQDNRTHAALASPCNRDKDGNETVIRRSK
jgi:hypothetical protein